MSDIPNEIASLLQKMRSATVTVFGDFCVDAYWSLSESTPEISVETGLPIRRVMTQRYSLGGAGNALANITDLGVGCVRAVGVAGMDIFGEKMRSLLSVRGTDMSGFLADDAWQTMVYTKTAASTSAHSTPSAPSSLKSSWSILKPLPAKAM